MKFDISGITGKLHGKATLPGDCRLTLSVMAYGYASGEKITIVNPSKAPGIQNFKKFLEDRGAIFSSSLEGFTFQRTFMERENIFLPSSVPEEIAHCAAVLSLGNSSSLRIENGSDERAPLVRFLLNLIPKIGFREIEVSQAEKDAILQSKDFSHPEIISASSSGEFETVAAAALFYNKPITLRYQRTRISHILNLLKALGCSFREEKARNNQNELERRLAKSSGEQPSEETRFEWESRPCTIAIPGDTTIGAALAAAASTIQKSEIILSNLLWEPGRRGFFDILRRMKGDIEPKVTIIKLKGSKTVSPSDSQNVFETADVRIRWSRLEGVRVNPIQAETMQDELMILGALAVFAKGETVIHAPDISLCNGCKGSFKILSDGLKSLGAHVGDFSRGIVIKGPAQTLKGNSADSGENMGVALALAITGMNSSGITSVSGFDENMHPIQDFLSQIRQIGGNFQELTGNDTSYM